MKTKQRQEPQGPSIGNFKQCAQYVSFLWFYMVKYKCLPDGYQIYFFFRFCGYASMRKWPMLFSAYTFFLSITDPLELNALVPICFSGSHRTTAERPVISTSTSPQLSIPNTILFPEWVNWVNCPVRMERKA